MLTFYPEFEVDSISDNEIILMLDLSNSMKVCPASMHVGGGALVGVAYLNVGVVSHREKP